MENNARLTTTGLRPNVRGRGKAREHCCLAASLWRRMYLTYSNRKGWRNALSTVMGDRTSLSICLSPSDLSSIPC